MHIAIARTRATTSSEHILVRCREYVHPNRYHISTIVSNECPTYFNVSTLRSLSLLCKADAAALLKDWHRFIPDSSMTQSDQLNSIVRFGAYYSLIMIALTRNVRHAWMFALGALLIVIVYQSAISVLKKHVRCKV